MTTKPIIKEKLIEVLGRVSDSVLMKEHDYSSKLSYSDIELNVQGIKQSVKVRLIFLEKVPGYLVLSGYELLYASVMMGESRVNALKESIERYMDQDLYGLPIENSLFVECKHCIRETSLREKNIDLECCRSSNSLVYYKIKAEDVEPLIRTTYPISEFENRTCELIAFDNKIFSSLDHFGNSFQLINHMVCPLKDNGENALPHASGEYVVLDNDQIYSYLCDDTKDEPLKLFALQYLMGKKGFIMTDSHAYNTYVSWVDFAKYNNLSPIKTDIQGVWRVNAEIIRPFEVQILSGRMFEHTKYSFKVGDCVQTSNRAYGYIVESTGMDRGCFEVEHEQSDFIKSYHASQLIFIEHTESKNVGSLVFNYNEGAFGVVEKEFYRSVTVSKAKRIQCVPCDEGMTGNTLSENYTHFETSSISRHGLMKFSSDLEIESLYEEFISLKSMSNYILCHQDKDVHYYMYRILKGAGLLSKTYHDSFVYLFNFILFVLLESGESTTYLLELMFEHLFNVDRIQRSENFIKLVVLDQRLSRYFSKINE